MLSKAVLAVKRLYEECGLIDPLDLSLETILNSKNIILKEEEMDGADGRIIMKENSAVITVNSKIDFVNKKRFAAVHELGHFELHKKNKNIYNDTEETFDQWYQTNFSAEEIEANEFAAEFLMPSEIFQRECKGKKFGPDVIEYLSNRFQVSKTAATLRFAKYGNYPVFVVNCKDNKMKWFKKSDDWHYYSLFEKDLPPPSGTVAYEVFTKRTIYPRNELKQDIWKSDWFVMKSGERDTKFYEYCLFVPSFNYSLSVIWED